MKPLPARKTSASFDDADSSLQREGEEERLARIGRSWSLEKLDDTVLLHLATHFNMDEDSLISHDTASTLTNPFSESSPSRRRPSSVRKAASDSDITGTTLDDAFEAELRSRSASSFAQDSSDSFFSAQDSIETIDGGTSCSPSFSTLMTNSGSVDQDQLIIELSSKNLMEMQKDHVRKDQRLGIERQQDQDSSPVSVVTPSLASNEDNGSGESTDSLDRRRVMLLAQARKRALQKKATESRLQQQGAGNRSQSFGSLTDSDRSLVAGVDVYGEASTTAKELKDKVHSEGFTFETQKKQTLSQEQSHNQALPAQSLREEVEIYGRRGTMKTGNSHEPIDKSGDEAIEMQLKHESITKPINKRKSLSVMKYTLPVETMASTETSERLRRMSMVEMNSIGLKRESSLIPREQFGKRKQSEIDESECMPVEDEQVPYDGGHIKLSRRISVPPSHISERSGEDDWDNNVEEDGADTMPVNIKPFGANGRRMSAPDESAATSTQHMHSSTEPFRDAPGNFNAYDGRDQREHLYPNPVTLVDAIGRRGSLDTQMSDVSFEGDGGSGKYHRRSSIGAPISSTSRCDVRHTRPSRRMSMPSVHEVHSISKDYEEEAPSYSRQNTESPAYMEHTSDLSSSNIASSASVRPELSHDGSLSSLSNPSSHVKKATCRRRSSIATIDTKDTEHSPRGSRRNVFARRKSTSLDKIIFSVRRLSGEGVGPSDSECIVEKARRKGSNSSSPTEELSGGSKRKVFARRKSVSLDKIISSVRRLSGDGMSPFDDGEDTSSSHRRRSNSPIEKSPGGSKRRIFARRKSVSLDKLVSSVRRISGDGVTSNSSHQNSNRRFSLPSSRSKDSLRSDMSCSSDPGSSIHGSSHGFMESDEMSELTSSMRDMVNQMAEMRNTLGLNVNDIEDGKNVVESKSKLMKLDEFGVKRIAERISTPGPSIASSDNSSISVKSRRRLFAQSKIRGGISGSSQRALESNNADLLSQRVLQLEGERAALQEKLDLQLNASMNHSSHGLHQENSNRYEPFGGNSVDSPYQRPYRRSSLPLPYENEDRSTGGGSRVESVPHGLSRSFTDRGNCSNRAQHLLDMQRSSSMENLLGRECDHSNGGSSMRAASLREGYNRHSSGRRVEDWDNVSRSNTATSSNRDLSYSSNQSHHSLSKKNWRRIKRELRFQTRDGSNRRLPVDDDSSSEEEDDGKLLRHINKFVKETKESGKSKKEGKVKGKGSILNQSIPLWQVGLVCLALCRVVPILGEYFNAALPPEYQDLPLPVQVMKLFVSHLLN